MQALSQIKLIEKPMNFYCTTVLKANRTKRPEWEKKRQSQQGKWPYQFGFLFKNNWAFWIQNTGSERKQKN